MKMISFMNYNDFDCNYTPIAVAHTIDDAEAYIEAKNGEPISILRLQFSTTWTYDTCEYRIKDIELV